MRLPFVKNSDEGPARAAQAALKALPRTTARNMLFIVFNIVFAILFRDAFGIMFSQTEAELYSHIVLIPFVSAYFLYSERRVIFSTPGSGACSGLFFLAAGLSLFIFGKVLAPWLGAIEINRPAKYGGPTKLENYAKLEGEYRGGKIHPLDLKNAVAEGLVKILEPVRSEFEKRPSLLRKMEQMQITR